LQKNVLFVYNMAKICALKINKVRRLIFDMLATLWHAEKLDVFLIAASHLWPVKISVLSPLFCECDPSRWTWQQRAGERGQLTAMTMN